MDDRTIYSAPAANYLLIIRGPGQGRRFLLLDGLATIGRATGNTIELDPGDVKASRRHAAIRVEAGMATVEDLGSKNGTLLDGSPVTKAPLPPGVELCVGETVFVLSQAGLAAAAPEEGPPANGGSKTGRRKALSAALAALVLVAVLLALYRGGKEGGEVTPKQGTPGQPLQTQTAQTQAAQTQPPQTQAAQGQAQPDQPTTGQTPQAPVAAPAAAPAAAKAAAKAEQSLEFTRLGQFFYNAGNLMKAVEQWREAIRLDPANVSASKLLVRAEGELDQLVDKHYRQALLALRYQRLEEARVELRQVVENSPNPGDERTKDSLKKLDELGGR